MSERNEGALFTPEGQLMFGQVREDSEVELYLLRGFCEASGGSVLSVASGGCTAFTLLSDDSTAVDAVDINEAQIALVSLKSVILASGGYDQALQAFSGDCTRLYEEMRGGVSSTHRAILDAQISNMRHGLNNTGWADRRMRVPASLFCRTVHSKERTEEFLRLTDLEEQRSYYDRQWSTWRWRACLRLAFNRLSLSLVHGRPVWSLAQHKFFRVMNSRFQHIFTTFPNGKNPYLWQAFLGRYPHGQEGLPGYLKRENWQELSSSMANLQVQCVDLIDWIERQPQGKYDFLHLSNVLELLPEEYARRLQPSLIRCSRTGSLVVLRFIFPRIAPVFAPDTNGLEYLPELSEEARARDRSFFCSDFQIYRRN